jgi:hypothetical protein
MRESNLKKNQPNPMLRVERAIDTDTVSARQQGDRGDGWRSLTEIGTDYVAELRKISTA